MDIKFSEDIIPISVFKVNPGKIVNQIQQTHRPAVLTSRGRGVAVVQSLQDFEANVEQQAFMKAVVQGMVDLEEGRELTLADVKKRLKIK
ncbi:MAG: type II toxin-antitoxin system Phd/YefM family antitoxin [Proteobacteria bacterium]|nr:type II toxin-antitoxin system Phd/YefM family antitoxin [Pseudomonadota bacterium]MBU4297313.1 type II toxin-antitoxin system Phd/YefM family antitoxin [Pseudomonadota bacterium]MCG2747747.1 type II toxin-antitoxin system Phd/YefM family antitoxin [Desulfobulbaceae bacterium]